MKTLAIFSSKGGVGKTTLAVTLARQWSAHAPLLLDLDRQNGTALYANALPNVTLRHLEAGEWYETTLPDVPVCIVDCPPDFGVAIPALENADLILTPFVAETPSINALYRTLDMLSANGYGDRVSAILSRYTPNDANARAARNSARNELGETLLDTTITARRIFVESARYGQTVLDYAPDGLSARQCEKAGTLIWGKLYATTT